MKSFITCKVCGKPLSGRQTMFCSSVCKNHIHQSYNAQKKRAIERKLEFVRLLGGKCGLCGYNENLAALSFHHKSGKEYQLDARSMSNRGLSEIVKEVKKCDLLCSNCHMKLHNPSLDLVKLSIEPTALTTELQAHKSNKFKTMPDTSLIIAKSGHIEKVFKEKLIESKLAKKRLVLGVSGGIDSVVMLDLFASNYPIEQLIVAHLDHGFREESSNDERFVRELARSYGLVYETETIIPPSEGNLEEYFRDKRRDFLRRTQEKYGAGYICLGHNADDQAETVLMNLVRGSGPAGLSGMQVHENSIIRPLLEISRAEIENYASEHSLAWQEDETNSDQGYSRNYIRKQILPLLSRLNPEYLANIGRSAEIQQDLDRYVRSEAAVIPAKAGIQENEMGSWLATRNDNEDDSRVSAFPRTINIEGLKNAPRPILYEVFGQMYENAKGNRSNLSREHLESIAKLIADNAGTKTIDLPDGFAANRRYDTLEINHKKVDNTVSPISENVLKIGKQIHNGFEFNVSLSSQRSQSQYELLIDRESQPFILVRDARPGDAIDKYGVSGKKKLQDLFVDAKIDRDRRKRWPIFVDTRNGEIVWVPGLAITKYMIPNQGDLLIKVSEE